MLIGLYECPSFLRNNRCQETTNLFTIINKSRKDIHEAEQITYSKSNLVIIDLLDYIHCYLLHSFDVGYNIKASDIFITNEESKNNELNFDIAPFINYK